MVMRSGLIILCLTVSVAAENPAESWMRRKGIGMPFTLELPTGQSASYRGGGDPVVDPRTGGRAWTEDLTLDKKSSGQWDNIIRMGYYDGWMKHELAMSPSRKTWGAPTSKKWRGYQVHEVGYNDLFVSSGDPMIEVHYIVETGPMKYAEILLQCRESAFKRYAPYYLRIRDSLRPIR